MNYLEQERRIHKLLKRSASYIGMIAEVESKCLLLKHRIKQGKSNELIGAFEQAAAQMKLDVAKYSHRLRKIYQELKEHGIISDVG